MPKAKITHLMTSLHERFGDDLTSPQQQQLIKDLQSHIHAWNEKEPVDPNFQDTVNVLLEDIEEEHPKAAVIVREIMHILQNIGV